MSGGSTLAQARYLLQHARRPLSATVLFIAALLFGASAALAAPESVREGYTALNAPPLPAPACTDPPGAPFIDVPITHPFCPEIQWMKVSNISTGFDDGTYRPSINVTRQAMSAFIARVADATPFACVSAPFPDVGAGHPFCKEIQWMKDTLISTGFGDGTYKPATNVTRQAMSAFLARVAGATPPPCASAPFPDVAMDHPFCKEIQWMKDNGISTGFDDGTYRPSNAVTRQAMSAFLYRVSYLVALLPVMTLADTSLAYTEDGPSVLIDNLLTVTDSGSPNLQSAAVKISSGMQTGDTLAFPGAPQITGTYDSGTGILTLTGSTSVANYQAALRTVTFLTTNNTPAAARVLQVTVNDGVHSSHVDSRHVSITANNDPPVPDNETFNGANSAVGNTPLVVNDPTDGAPAQSDPKKSITGDVLDGDTDPDGPGPLTITPAIITTANGGLAVIQADGDFSYISDPADGCTPTSDSFTYTVNDNGTPNRTANGTVTIGLQGCVWYVNNNATGNSGSSIEPFDTLAQAQAVSGTSHTIFVFDGDNTTTGYNAGITLKNNQRLLGENVNLVVDSVTLWTATANRPTITDHNADVVELASANIVQGFQIEPSGSGGGIGADSLDTSGQIIDVRIIDTGTAGQQPMLELNSTAGNWSITNLTIDNSAATSPPNTAKGVLLLNAGTVTFQASGTISITVNGAAGLDAQGTNMGTSSVFDSITVTGSNAGAIRLVNNTGTTTLGDGVGTDLSLTTTSGTAPALLVGSPGTLSIPAAGTSNISATGGPAVDVQNGTGVTSMSLDLVSSTNSANYGIRLDQLGLGTFSAASGSIVGAGTTAFSVAGGSGDITYPGSLGDGAGASVSISTRSGGAIMLSGAISDSADAGGGITLTSNTGGTTTISNTSVVLNTGVNSALLFNTSDGHTLTLSGGGLDIDTTNGHGIQATTSGTLIITGANNSISTGSGTPLNLVNTDIGVGGLNFVSISSGAAGNGIVLNNTGTTAGLTVTGDGGSTVNNTGGTLNGVTGDAIFLHTTVSVSLDQMNIVNAGGSGINGTSVTGFSLTNSTIAGAGNNANEYGIFLTNLFGTGTLNNVSAQNSQTNNLKVSNNAATAGTLNISNCVFTTTDATNGGDAVNIETGVGGAAVGNLTVNLSDNNDLNLSQGDGIQAAANDNSTLRVTVTGTNSNYNGNLGSAVNLAVEGNATLYALVQNLNGVSTGTSSANGLNVINAQIIEASGNPTLHATIQNNTITGLGNNASGIRTVIEGTGTLNAKLLNNVITGMGANGIQGQARAGTGVLNLTIANNSVNLASPSALDGISIQSGSSGGGDTNTVRLDMFDSDSATAGVGLAGYRLHNRAGTTFVLEDYAGAPTNTMQVASWITAPPKSNTGSSTIVISGTGFGTIADVTEPTLP